MKNCGGCTVLWRLFSVVRDIISAVRDIISAVRDIINFVEGYHQYFGAVLNTHHSIETILKILHSIALTFSTLDMQIEMLSTRIESLATFDFPHSYCVFL